MTVLDGNGNVFPAALGIAESENVETWFWFLALVKTAFQIGLGEGLVVLGDCEKGLDAALKALLQSAAHSYCVYHIEKNVKCTFHTSLDGLLFRAAKASNQRMFNEVLNQIKALDPAAGRYIEEIEKAKWARAFFPMRRFGHVTSNISESMNWWFEEARHLNPVALFIVYIRRLNQLFERRRIKYASMAPTDLPRKVSKKFAKCLEQSRKLRVLRHTNTLFEVQSLKDPRQFRIVDFERRTCSCGFFTEHGIPCRHMCAAALSVKIHPKTFIIRERTREALTQTYTGVTIPIDIGTLTDDGLKGPIGTRKRGRPKEKRIRSATEKGPRHTVKCGRCGKRGHNKRSCKAVID